jgi:hypothetical protein
MTHGVETTVHERQRGTIRRRNPTVARICVGFGARGCDLQTDFRHIGEDDIAAGLGTKVKSRPSGSGTNVEKPFTSTKLQQFGDLFRFVSCRPTRPAIIAAANPAFNS